MLHDFELEARHNKKLRDMRERWRKKSMEHNERVEEMKKRTESMYKKNMNEYKKKILLKEQGIRKKSDLKKKILSEEKNKSEDEEIQKNINDFKIKEEQKRLVIEREIFERSNFYIFYNIAFLA